MSELRPEVLAFAQLMEAKLRENDHKGGWRHENESYLAGRLNEEIHEFKIDLTVGTSDLDLTGEAADVANFLMMILDNRGQLPTTDTKQNHDAVTGTSEGGATRRQE